MVEGRNSPSVCRGKNPEARQEARQPAPHKAQQERRGHGGRTLTAPQEPEGGSAASAEGARGAAAHRPPGAGGRGAVPASPARDELCPYSVFICPAMAFTSALSAFII